MDILQPPEGQRVAAKLVGRTRFSLADTFGFRRMPGIELAAALALLLVSDLAGLSQGIGKDLLQPRITIDFTSYIADQSSQTGF